MTASTLTRTETRTVSPFDSTRQFDDHGNEFWSARDLMPLMGYVEWRKFDESIQRAKASASAQNMDVTSHVVRADKVVARPQGGSVSRADYRLTRFAAYLVAMNGDPRKSEVAAAQSYFAVNTYENEQRKQYSIPATYAEAQNIAVSSAFTDTSGLISAGSWSYSTIVRLNGFNPYSSPGAKTLGQGIRRGRGAPHPLCYRRSAHFPLIVGTSAELPTSGCP